MVDPKIIRAVEIHDAKSCVMAKIDFLVADFKMQLAKHLTTETTRAADGTEALTCTIAPFTHNCAGIEAFVAGTFSTDEQEAQK